MLLASGRVDEALMHLKKGLNGRSDSLDARYNPGDAQANVVSAPAEIGNLKEARENFERAEQFDPKNEIARENFERQNRERQGRPNKLAFGAAANSSCVRWAGQLFRPLSPSKRPHWYYFPALEAYAVRGEQHLACKGVL